MCSQSTGPGYQYFSKQYLLWLLIYCLNLMPSHGTCNTPNISQVDYESNIWKIIMLFWNHHPFLSLHIGFISYRWSAQFVSRNTGCNIKSTPISKIGINFTPILYLYKYGFSEPIFVILVTAWEASFYHQTTTEYLIRRNTVWLALLLKLT